MTATIHWREFSENSATPFIYLFFGGTCNTRARNLLFFHAQSSLRWGHPRDVDLAVVMVLWMMASTNKSRTYRGGRSSFRSINFSSSIFQWLWKLNNCRCWKSGIRGENADIAQQVRQHHWKKTFHVSGWRSSINVYQSPPSINH